MKKKSLCALLIGSMLLGITGCSNFNSQGDSTKNTINSENTPDKSEESTENTEKLDPGSVQVNVSQSNLDNSLYVLDLVYDEQQDNVLFCPLSLNYALGLLYEGSSNQAHDDLAEYLKTEEFGNFAEQYNDYIIANYNDSNETYGYRNKFTIANAIWFSDTINLLDSYRDNVIDKYDAKIECLDFSNPLNVCEKVNSWSNETTDGLIPEILKKEQIGPDTKNILTNSVYFESSWEQPWYYDENYKEKFTNIDGSTVDTCYMTAEGDAYFENDKAVAFSYKYNNGLEFIGILPKEDGDFNISDLDIESLLESRNFDFTKLKIKMPKLNYDTTINLESSLRELGLDSIFDTRNGFGNMADESLYVDNIIQKTKIELDENGTKAAAVTAIIMDCGSAIDNNPIIKEVYLDRPFSFLIYDRENNQVIFVGKVVNVK